MNALSPAPFRNSQDHLAAELAWLDRALLTLVRAARPVDGAGHGWFVSAGEAEALLLNETGMAPAEPSPELAAARREILEQVQAARASDIPLVLPRLSALFGLTPEEECLLVACVAAERDARYGKVYAYLHDDATRRSPSAALVTAIAALDERCPPGGGALHDPHAAVYRWRLAEVSDRNGIRGGIVLDPGVLALLTGFGWADPHLEGVLRSLPNSGPDNGPDHGIEAWPYDDTAKRLSGLLRDEAGQLLAHFHGPAAAEGRRVARSACDRLDVPLLHADLAELLALDRTGALPLAEGLRRVYRQAALTSAAVYLSGMDAVLDDSRSAAHLDTLSRLIAEASWFTCTEAERMWLPDPAAGALLRFLPFDLPVLDYAQRRAAWRRAAPALSAEQTEVLATRFPSAPSEIADAVRLAAGRTRARGDSEPEAFDDLVWACQIRPRAELDGLTRVVTPRAGWDDLVLPADTVAQLRELCAQVRHRGRVLHEWGLAGKGTLGHGVQALFLGPSGTGKTLAAEVIAAAVGMDLVKVDLSTVVSKYIGETEKHLARLFSTAERCGSILFFDEADALFGKRSEVTDAHDRYANIETSYLLQRIEEYTGVVILATNFAGNFDDAFQRRIRVSVAFPFPDETARLAIWRRHLPPGLPVTADLDLTGIARQFKVSGGVIRKIVWNAAFLAAADGGRVGMAHLLLATRREYERMGKPFAPTEAAFR